MLLFKNFAYLFLECIFCFDAIIFLFQWSNLYVSRCLCEVNFANGLNATQTGEIVKKVSRHNPKQKRYYPFARNRSEPNIRNDMRSRLYFIYYKDGKILLKNSPGTELSHQRYSFLRRSCVKEKISFIFHGWTESCSTDWILQLQERLSFYRGGCIICVDYSSWSNKPYIELLKEFDPLSYILYEEVNQLIAIGFSPSKIFMFGFSYGGQIASKLGRLLKPNYKINKIDICDMAGPGFDFVTHLNHSEAAENVHCYYSSLDKGSNFFSCHRNIRFGQCGYTQPAILSQPQIGSHGLCVRMYINAFDFPFYAVKKSLQWCIRGKTIADFPDGYTVGYKDDGDFKHTEGDLFVPTSLNYPYNLSKKDILLYEKYLAKV